MDLLEMVVTVVCGTDTPYEFQAKELSNGPTHKVQLVMPLGGVESGLYRSPKLNEKVLVGVTGEGASARYYLMGYLPTYTEQQEGNPEAEPPIPEVPASQDFQTQEILTDNGEVFRYKQTGKTAAKEGAEHYSEIGFYQKPTKWAPDKDHETDYATISRIDQINIQPTGDAYPKIDRINIHSTGDIHESAVNHHQVKAARLELLADSDDTEADSFKHGDMRIKANQDITIEAGGALTLKAEGTLTLKAGRTTLVLSDSGFSVTHRIMSADIPNTLDAGFSLSYRNGISMSGQAVGINSKYKWSIADALGAGVSGTAGVLNLSGRQISAGTANMMAQLSGNIMYGLECGSSIATAGAALHERQVPGHKEGAEDFAFWFAKVDALVKLGVDLFFTIYKLRKKYNNAYSLQKDKLLDKLNKNLTDAQAKNAALQGNVNASAAQRDAAQANEAAATAALNAETRKRQRAQGQALDNYPYDLSQIASLAALEPYEALASMLEILLTITSIVYSQIESFVPDVTIRDNLNFAALIVDNSILETFTAIMMGFSGSGMGAASLCLSHDGNMVIKAAADKSFYADNKTESAAALSLYPGWAIITGIAGTIAGKVPAAINTIEAMIKGPGTQTDEKETL
jgi:hypothetical protein